MIATNPDSSPHDDADLVPARLACPMCGERHQDRLVWIDEDRVRCANCNAEYEPGKGGGHDA